MKREEYFVDFYKWKGEELEVRVKAIYDKNGKELYNGAKAILDVPYGEGFEMGKIVISSFVNSNYGHEYSYAFKPKKGSQLWIEEDGSNVELI